MWNGRRCFVVGGGPSLRGFDWRKLEGERVIAVNRAYEKLDPFALVCSMDLRFWKLHGAHVQRRFHTFSVCGRRPHALHVRVGDEKLPMWGPDRVVPCCADLSKPNPHLQAVWGTSLASGLGCGGNSGFAAVNLADALGARTIFLLGFDMVGKGGRTVNWHDGYGETQDEDVYARMCAAFDAVHMKIRARVVNLSPISKLQCFARARLQDVLP